LILVLKKIKMAFTRGFSLFSWMKMDIWVGFGVGGILK